MPRRAVAERPMVGEREKKLDHFFWRLLLQKGGKNILLPPRLFHLLLASSHSLHSANSSDMKNVQSFLQLSILETTIPASGTAVSGVRVHIYQFKNQVASHLLDFQLECNSNAKTVERNAIRSDMGPLAVIENTCKRIHFSKMFEFCISRYRGPLSFRPSIRLYFCHDRLFSRQEVLGGTESSPRFAFQPWTCVPSSPLAQCNQLV
jgi:hypothetical protein